MAVALIPILLYTDLSYTEGFFIMNIKKAEEAITMLLEAIGENPNREGLKDTPKRVAKMFEEIVSGMNKSPSQHLSVTFSSGGSDIVIQKDIEFHSLCEHHLLPFFGKVHIAYLPNDKVVGLSKLSRVVDVFARRLQIQEQLTTQIANAISEHLNTNGVMVVIEAEHTCISMRGIKKIGTKTITMHTNGVFKEDYNMKKEVLDLIK